MNKKQLIDTIASKNDIKKVEAKRIFDSFIDIVIEALKRGETVRLVGFGTFRVVERAERIGTNPLTGKKIKIPAKKVVKFRPSKDLLL